MFNAFFEKYALKLVLDNLAQAQDLCDRTTRAKPLSAYSRQLQTCRA